MGEVLGRRISQPAAGFRGGQKLEAITLNFRYDGLSRRDLRKNNIQNGAKGWATSMTATGKFPALELFSKSQPVRVGTSGIGSFADLVHFFQNNPSFVQMEEGKRKATGPDRQIVLEILFGNEITGIPQDSSKGGWPRR